MSIGIRNIFRNSADQAVAASAVLVNATGLAAPLAAGQSMLFDATIPFSVGASGGFKFFLTTPAALAAFTVALFAFDGVTAAPGSQVGVVQSAAANFANAWAVAGQHLLKISGTITNGVNAGTVQLQFACNSAANAITLLKGGWIDVTYL